MILVIDTSSAGVSVVATIDGATREERHSPRLSLDELRVVARSRPVTKVAVATGPGSFTGLRVGISFGLGLAMGLRVPIVPLPTLALQAARAGRPATAIVDAGRGRFYFQVPGEPARLGAPADIPLGDELVGNVLDRSSLISAGHRFVPEPDLTPVVDAAAKLLETAPEVPYRNLEIEYMQSFSKPAKSEASA